MATSMTGEQSILGKVRPFLGSVTCTDEALRNASMAAGVTASPASINRAAQPAAWGLAWLVPEMTVVPPASPVDVIPTPGARRSVVALVLAKPATTSVLSTAATETTLLRQAGEVIWVPEPSFPEEAKAMTPRARSVLMAA